MQQSGDDAVENLRSKILPGLQKIRFASFTQLEVAQLCEEELGEVLTAEEKYSILKSSVKGDWKMMPPGFASSSKLAPRHGPYTFCPLPFIEDKPLSSKGTNKSKHLSLAFEVNRKTAIVGVKLNMNAFCHSALTLIKLYKSSRDEYGDDQFICEAVPKFTSLYRGEMYCKINGKLSAGREYKLIFTFGTPLGDSSGECKTYSLPKDELVSSSDGLALAIRSGWLKSFVHIQGILFKKVTCLIA
jgi:hypothetical protein